MPLRQTTPARPGKADSEDASSESLDPAQLTWVRWLAIGLAGGGLLLVIAAWLAGDWIAMIAAIILVLSALQGLWRGASRVIGIVVASLLAVWLAPRLGKGLEGVTSSLFGTGGVVNRLVATLVVGAAIITAGSILLTWPIARWMRHKPRWRAWDRFVGAGFGLIEGIILVLVLLWAPKALEPIARAQIEAAQDQAASGQPARKVPALAYHVLEAAEAVDKSSIGGVAKSTNPLNDARIMQVARDFAAISRNPQARQSLNDSPVIKKLGELPSLKHAIEVTKNDPELAKLYDAGGIDTQGVWTFLNSPTVLDLIDNTTLLKDLEPLAGDLQQALHEARAKAPSSSTGPR